MFRTVVCDDLELVDKCALDARCDQYIMFLGVVEMVDLAESDVLIFHENELV